MNLSMITYISLHGKSNSVEEIDLLCEVGDYSLEKFGFHEVIILSASKPSKKPKHIKLFEIEPCDFYDYNQIAFNQLHNYVKTDFMLIFQSDGWATNENLWDDEYLNYDYIGAPWKLEFSWSAPGREVGNSGFCLRSRKISDLCSTLSAPRGYHDDGLICVNYRDYLISQGVKFAPLQIGYKFSIENAFDEHHKIENTFGFHGKHLVDMGKKILFK